MTKQTITTRPKSKGMFFVYGLEQPLALGAGASLSRGITIDSDADFLANHLVMRYAGAFLLQITDNTTGQQWFNRPIDCRLFLQDSGNVYWIPRPKFCKRNSTLTIQLTDISGAGNNISLALSGSKIYTD